MAATTPEQRALERFQRLTAASLAEKKREEETDTLILEEEKKCDEYEDKIRAYNVALDQQLQERAKLVEKTETAAFKGDVLSQQWVAESFAKQPNDNIVTDVCYRYEKPKDQETEMAITTDMANSLASMKNNTVAHLGLDLASVQDIELDEASVVYHDDHMTAALKDGTVFTHRNHPNVSNSFIEYQLPDKYETDIFAQAMRLGSISAMLAAMNHYKPEYGRWHQTRPVMVQPLPQVLDRDASLPVLAKAIEIFQLAQMGYKMMDHFQQELSFDQVKHTTQNLFHFIHQGEFGLDFGKDR